MTCWSPAGFVTHCRGPGPFAGPCGARTSGDAGPCVLCGRGRGLFGALILLCTIICHAWPVAARPSTSSSAPPRLTASAISHSRSSRDNPRRSSSFSAIRLSVNRSNGRLQVRRDPRHQQHALLARQRQPGRCPRGDSPTVAVAGQSDFQREVRLANIDHLEGVHQLAIHATDQDPAARHLHLEGQDLRRRRSTTREPRAFTSTTKAIMSNSNPCLPEHDCPLMFTTGERYSRQTTRRDFSHSIIATQCMGRDDEEPWSGPALMQSTASLETSTRHPELSDDI